MSAPDPAYVARGLEKAQAYVELMTDYPPPAEVGYPQRGEHCPLHCPSRAIAPGVCAGHCDGDGTNCTGE
ncbi:hypothetical protein [Amycolatopsis sp. NBC_00438]|uniref:hypothetical protein n=1 Tax=Amycolatopsis sp. NBC_00438 TaxID=2903558 RepID=UPI002E247522